MNKLLLSVIIFLFMQLIISCASSQEAISYSYEKIDEERQTAYTEIWIYRYSIANGPWEEIKVYVLNEKLTYIINVEMNPGLIWENWGGHLGNSYVYYSMKRPPNFTSKTRSEQGRVNSLEEAIETALRWYIEDYKARKQ